MADFNISETQARLAEAEKLIEITKTTREEALKRKTECLTKLDISKEELKKLGVTPENAEAELTKLQDEILSELNNIENNIPKDLLKALRRI